MNQIEEQKKLVVEFLGFAVKIHHHGNVVWSDTFAGYETHHHFDDTVFSAWNPQDNDTGRQWWPEIWDKMTPEQKTEYTRNLCLVIFGAIPHNFYMESLFEINTAKPSDCWEATIKMLTKD